jgi:hypothetical protein
LGDGIVLVFDGVCRQAAQARERQAASDLGDLALQIAFGCFSDLTALDDHPA